MFALKLTVLVLPPPLALLVCFRSICEEFTELLNCVVQYAGDAFGILALTLCY